MDGGRRGRAGKLAALAAVVALVAASAALGSTGSSTRQRPSLDAQKLDTRVHAALLDVYALDSRLQAAHGRFSTLAARAAALRRERSELRRELGADRQTLHVAERGLAQRLRDLYEEGSVDPVAVVLGASSLTAALRRLDDLSSVADESRQVVAVARAAHRRLLTTRAGLAAEARRLAQSLAAARAAEQSLADAAAARRSYVSSLRTRSRLQATQVSEVVSTAAASARKSAPLQAAPAAAPPPATSGRSLVVSATCYDLPGTTATGMPVGWGVVAVDPSVIPLGTRLYVPGYGKGVAADVGGGIKGAIVDLWMPPAQCGSWGRRTVTITIY